jgi:hypothetical protein
LGDVIEKGELGGACDTSVEEERCMRGLVGKLEGKRPLGLGIEGKIILKLSFTKQKLEAT